MLCEENVVAKQTNNVQMRRGEESHGQTRGVFYSRRVLGSGAFKYQRLGLHPPGICCMIRQSEHKSHLCLFKDLDTIYTQLVSNFL